MERRKINTRRRKICLFIVIYTVLFACLALWLDSIFAAAGRTFIWKVDGLSQHIVALKYIRNALITFFTTGKFAMVDYTIGQGFDVIGTLNYYGLGDPVTLLTVLFPETSLERMYEVLIFVRMYLSGIGVAYLCKTLGKTKLSTVIPASLLYAFCAFSLIGGIRHPMFFCGIMYLPLLIAGVEKVIRDKKIGTLVIVVALSFSSNYYFMYMNTIIAAVYFFIRQIGTYRSDGVKKFFLRVGKIVLSYIWGIGLSAVILFPAVYAFLSNARTGAELAQPPALYNGEYYRSLLESLAVPYTAFNNWAVPGIGILGVFALSVLIARWKKTDRKLLLGFAALFLMMVFPYVGKIMNGFSYSTMRFSYAMALLLVVMFVYAVDALKEVKIVNMCFAGLILVGTCGYLIYSGGKQYKTEMFYVTAILGFVCIGVIVSYLVFRQNKYAKYILYILSLTAFVNIAFNCHALFDKEQNFRCWDYVQRGYLKGDMGPRSARMMKAVGDNSFYRIERERDIKNKSMFFGFHQTCFYWSVVPKGMTDLFVSTCISDYYKTYVMKSLERRTGLLSLASVKYYVNYEQDAPFGFYNIREKKIDGKKVYLYENACYLPLGVTYSSFMTREQYNKLNPVEREQALLTSAVVEEKVEGIEKNNKIEGVKVTPISVREQKKIKVSEVKMKSRRGAVITYQFDGEPDSQTYIVFKNIRSKDSDVDKTSALYKGKYGTGHMRVIGDYAGSYFHKDGSVLNLGYSKESQKEFKLKFKRKRRYTFDGAYAVSVPISKYLDNIKNLKKNTLENVKMKNNLITGTIQADKDEILQISVPYSTGYTVYVDGKKTDSFSSSVAYLGVKIEKGNHTVRVEYTSPFIVLGFVVTLISLLLFVAYIIFGKKLKKFTL